MGEDFSCFWCSSIPFIIYMLNAAVDSRMGYDAYVSDGTIFYRGGEYGATGHPWNLI